MKTKIKLFLLLVWLIGCNFTAYPQQREIVKVISLDTLPIALDNKGDIEQAIKKQYNIPDIYELKINDLLQDKKKPAVKDIDEFGVEHKRYHQYYKGIKIENSDIRIRYKNDIIESLNGEYVDVPFIDISIKLSPEKAIEAALNAVNAKEYKWENEAENNWLKELKNDESASFYPTPELVICANILNPEDNSLHLAYKMDIYATEPLSREYVYVDANNGEILNREAIIKQVNGTAATRYSSTRTISTNYTGTGYRLRDYDSNRGSGIETYNMRLGTNYSSAVDFTDVDNNWTAAEYNNAAKDNGALDAHWGAMMTYDYFKNTHGRNSYNNRGGAIRNYVHYKSKYENAFWDGSVMTYGDGDVDFDILMSIDVVAHEIAHGICEYTANLAYQKESGAINEGLSDIWAACVEDYCVKNYSVPNKDIWLIGENINLRPNHVALRSMKEPKRENQPDTYGGTYWISQDCSPSIYNDYCGVHTNSGVMNHWFYLLSEGGKGTNDINNKYDVTGIGINAAAKIVYRAQSNYMTSGTNYAGARTYTIQAAIDLYGSCSQQVVSAIKAWHAVGVGAKSTSQIVILNSNIYTADATINVCSIELNNVRVQNGAKLTLNATQEIVINEGFEVVLGSQLVIN